MKTQFFKLSLGLIAIMIMMSSCYKDYDDVYLADLDITLTYYDDTKNFSSYNSFVVRDSIGIVTDHLSEIEKRQFFTPDSPS